MIRIAITAAAFDAIAATLPLGTVSLNASLTITESGSSGPSPNVVNKLRALRGSGES